MFQLPYLVSMRVNSNISVQPLSERELYLILHWLPLMPGMLLSNKYQPRRVFHNVSPYNPGGVELINETTSMEQIYITYLPYGYTYTYTYGYSLIYITLTLWLYPVVNCCCLLTNHWRGEYEISFLLYLVQIFHGTKVSSDFWISAMEEIFLVSSIKILPVR